MKPSSELLTDSGLADKADEAMTAASYTDLGLTYPERKLLGDLLASVASLPVEDYSIDDEEPLLVRCMRTHLRDVAGHLRDDLQDHDHGGTLFDRSPSIGVDEFVSMVERGAPSIWLDWDMRVLVALRNDVAFSLSSIRTFAYALDLEDLILKRLESSVEGESGKGGIKAAARRLFDEAYPEFNTTRRTLTDRLYALSDGLQRKRVPVRAA